MVTPRQLLVSLLLACAATASLPVCAPARTAPSLKPLLGSGLASGWHLPVPPVPMDGRLLAYDSLRNRLILVVTDGSVEAQVWAYPLTGGSGWDLLAVLTYRDAYPGSPMLDPEDGCAIYDPMRDRVLLFGFGYLHGAMWSLALTDPPTLTLIQSQSAPLYTYWSTNSGTVIYDTKRDRLVLFEQVTDNPQCHTEMYAMSLAASQLTWDLLEVPQAFPSRSGAYLVYDSRHDRIVVHSGRLCTGGYPTDTWAFDCQTLEWTQLQPTGGTGSNQPPEWRSGAAVAYDPTRSRMLMFGGARACYSCTGPDVSDTWALELGDSLWWHQLPASPAPARINCGAVYCGGRDEFLVWGGYSYPGTDYAAGTWMNDLWSIAGDGIAWSPLAPSTAWPIQIESAVWDRQRSRLIVLGPGGAGDVWTTTGSEPVSWDNLSTAGDDPGSRSAAVATYDASSDRVLLFGGAGQGYLGDLWQLSLQPAPTWSRVTASGEAPSPRSDAAAAVDELGQRIFVFGGTNNYGVSGCDNYVWQFSFTANAWTMYTPTGDQPSARYGASAVWDSDNQRILVYGGSSDRGYPVSDVWAFALTPEPHWTQLSPTGAVPARRSQAALYDSQSKSMIVFGGRNAPDGGYYLNYLNDVWRLSLGTAPAWTAVDPGSLQPARVSGTPAVLLPGTTTALLAGGGDTKRSLWRFEIPSCPILPAPANLVITNLGTGRSLRLSWSEVAGAMGYEIHRSDGFVYTQSGADYVDGGLVHDTTYTYQVRAINACAIGPLSQPASGTPRYFPVLLVHGIWSNHAAFTDCPGGFPCDIPNPTRLGDQLHAMGLQRLYYADYPKAGALPEAAAAVRTRLHEVVAACPGEKVILVAHSQGGLISRYLLEHGDADNIAQVIMLGTPSHGSDLALLEYLLDTGTTGTLRPYERVLVHAALGQLGINQVKDLIPGSTFLTQLNYGPDGTPDEPTGLCPSRPAELLPKDVPLWLIHGTSQWCSHGLWAKLLRPSNLLCVPNDGVVETGQGTDGDLIALPSEFKRIDERLDTHTPRQLAAHFPGAAGGDNPCSATLLTHDGISRFVYQIIAGIATSAEPSPPLAHITQQANGEPPLQSLARRVGVAGVEVVEDTFHVEAAREVWFVQSGVSAGLTFGLRSPTGQSFTSADTSAEVSFIADSSLAVQAFVIQTPLPGSWVLSTSGSAQEYLVEALAETDTVLDVAMHATAATVVVTARLNADGVAMMDAVLSGTMRGPAGEPPLSFYDDGNHADGAAGDGLWGASASAPEPGGYACSVQARSYAGNAVVLERAGVGGIVVESVCDLRIPPEGVVVSRAGVSRDSLLVTAAVENTTDISAPRVYVAMSADGVPPLRQGPLAVPPHTLQRVTFLWQPTDTTETQLRLYIDDQTLLTQARYDNDTVSVRVTPATVGVTGYSTLGPSLEPITPNPARQGCTVQFSLPEGGVVSLRVFDVAGRKVAALRDGWLPAGVHRVRWDGTLDGGARCRPGFYYCQLRSASARLTRPIILLR